jgi:hypothetical protein
MFLNAALWQFLICGGKAWPFKSYMPKLLALHCLRQQSLAPGRAFLSEVHDISVKLRSFVIMAIDVCVEA